MRRELAVFAVAWICVALASRDATPAEGEGIRAGDVVHVVRGPAPLKDRKNTLALVRAGVKLRALQVKGGWVRVQVPTGSGTLTGWLHARRLRPAASASERSERQSVRPASRKARASSPAREPPDSREERKAAGREERAAARPEEGEATPREDRSLLVRFVSLMMDWRLMWGFPVAVCALLFLGAAMGVGPHDAALAVFALFFMPLCVVWPWVALEAVVTGSVSLVGAVGRVLCFCGVFFAGWLGGELFWRMLPARSDSGFWRWLLNFKLRLAEPEAFIASVKDQDLLEELALTHKDEEVASLAAKALAGKGRMGDQRLLRELALRADSSKVRGEAAERITDEETLVRLARHDPDAHVRETAVGKVADQELLSRIAFSDHSSTVRVAAVKRVEDQRLLCSLATRAPHGEVQEEAIEKLEDDTLLAQVALSVADRHLKERAVVRLSDQRVLVERIGQGSSREVRKGVVGSLTDRALLEELSETAELDELREVARNRLDELAKRSRRSGHNYTKARLEAAHPGRAPHVCPDCGGKGFITRHTFWGLDWQRCPCGCRLRKSPVANIWYDELGNEIH